MNAYAIDQSEAQFNAMMKVQEAMDQSDAWDYNAEIKRYYLN